MSYLTTIVHPLIIIRLLEHRLFTPLLKKTVKPRTSTNFTSLSISSASTNLISNNSIGVFQKPQPYSSVSSSHRMTPSNSFQYTVNSSDLPNKKPYRKLSEVSCSRISENISEGNKPSKEEGTKTPVNDPANDETDQDRHQTKSTKLKDFSKKFLKRVNSGNQYYYNNIKKNFKSTNFNRSKKSHDVNSSNNSDKEFDKENFLNQRVDSTGSTGHVDRNSFNEDSLNVSSPTANSMCPTTQNQALNKSNFYF